MATEYRSTTLYDGPIQVDLPTSFEDIRYVLLTFDGVPWHMLTLCSEQRGAEDTEFVFGDRNSFTTIIFDVTSRVSLPSEELKSKIPAEHLQKLEDAAAAEGRELGAKDINPLVDSDIDAMLFHLEDIMELREDLAGKSEEEKQKFLNEIDVAEVWEGPQPVRCEHVNKPCYGMTVKMTRNPRSTRRVRPEDPDFVVVILTLVRWEEEDTDVVVAVNVPHRQGEYQVGREKESEGMRRGKAHVERIRGTFELRGSFFG